MDLYLTHGIIYVSFIACFMWSMLGFSTPFSPKRFRLVAKTVQNCKTDYVKWISKALKRHFIHSYLPVIYHESLITPSGRIYLTQKKKTTTRQWLKHPVLFTGQAAFCCCKTSLGILVTVIFFLTFSYWIHNKCN